MNLICLIGIQQYLYLFLYSINSLKKYISLLIYLNGMLFHSLAHSKLCNIIKYYDILTNIFLIIYCNYYTLWQYNTLYITIFSSFSFIVKSIFIKNKSSFKSQTIHVITVQYPLYYILKNFEYNNILN